MIDNFDDHDFTQYLDFGDAPATVTGESDEADNLSSIPYQQRPDYLSENPPTLSGQFAAGHYSLPGDPGAADLAAGDQVPAAGRYKLPGEDFAPAPGEEIPDLQRDNGRSIAKADYSKNSVIAKLKGILGSTPKMAAEPVSAPVDTSVPNQSNPLADRQAQLDAALADRTQNMRNSVLRGAGDDFLNADRIARGRKELTQSIGDQRLMKMEDLKLKDLNENLALAPKVGSEEKSKMELNNIAALNDPNSPQTHAMKQGLKQLFGDRISPDTLEKMTGSQLQALDKDLGGIFTKIDDRAMRKEELDARRDDRKLDRELKLSQISSIKESKEDARQAKADEKDIKRIDTANKLITSEVASGRNAFGIAAKNLQSIGNVKALLDGSIDPNDLDTRQVYEMTKTLDRILSQSGGTISGTEHLTPDTARSRLSKLMEYVTNTRQGAKAGSFVNNMSHTFDREEKQAHQQIHNASKALLSTYTDLKDRPATKDLWDNMILNHGLDPADFEKGAAGFKQPKEEKSYSVQQEQGIKNVMDAHPGVSREEVIKQLKKAGKIQ